MVTSDVRIFERYVKVFINLYSKDRHKKLLFSSMFNISKSPQGITVSSDPRFEVTCSFVEPDGSKVESKKLKDKKENWLHPYFGNKKDLRVHFKDANELRERLEKRIMEILYYNMESCIDNINAILSSFKGNVTEENFGWIKATFNFAETEGVDFALFKSALNILRVYIHAQEPEIRKLFRYLESNFYTVDRFDAFKREIMGNGGIFMPVELIIDENSNSTVEVLFSGYSWHNNPHEFLVNESLIMDTSKLGKLLIEFMEAGDFQYKGGNKFSKSVGLLNDFE